MPGQYQTTDSHFFIPMGNVPTNRFFSFIGGQTGQWRVVSHHTVSGEAFPETPRIQVVAGIIVPSENAWCLRGITSNERYVERAERDQLVTVQQDLGRNEAICAALIPIRKHSGWWSMTQDERRSIFAAQSRHIEIGSKYLPPIARRLHHCRDLSESEQFDFLTWFEFSPQYASVFDDLLGELRATPEWQYVDREIDIRLVRDNDSLQTLS
jgi:hypothetical protein